MAVAAYTSRPRTTETAGAVRLMLCDQGDADCNRLCTARHSQLETCDSTAGFDDRELFELLLEPGHRSPLYRSSHLAAGFALGLATGQMLKAIAEQRGWEHHRHRHYHRAASRIRAATGDGEIRRLFDSASALHENFYEDDMVADEVDERLDDVEALVGRLLPLLIQT